MTNSRVRRIRHWWRPTYNGPCLYLDDPMHPEDDVCAICAPVWTRAKWELSYRWDRLGKWFWKGIVCAECEERFRLSDSWQRHWEASHD